MSNLGRVGRKRPGQSIGPENGRSYRPGNETERLHSSGEGKGPRKSFPTLRGEIRNNDFPKRLPREDAIW